jgi:hypothetical protein
MTLADDVRAAQPGAPPRSLADRRPGHAVMTKVLSDIGPAGEQHVAPEILLANRSWYDGATGELIVGHELAQLPSTWRVLHAIPIGRNGRDIDHLVIGPGGVFVLNTKRHVEARVRVGTKVTWIRDRTERYQINIAKVAAEVDEKLGSDAHAPVRARPVLVFVQAGSFTHVGPQEVAAVQSHQVIAFLQSQPAVLTEEQVESIADLAGRPETWGATQNVLDEPDPTVRFLGLRPPTAPSVQPLPPRTPAFERRSGQTRHHTAPRRYQPRRTGFEAAALASPVGRPPRSARLPTHDPDHVRTAAGVHPRLDGVAPHPLTPPQNGTAASSRNTRPPPRLDRNR